jgi:curved DNA-binding protein CbpA
MKHESPPDLYAELGVPKDAKPEAIKRAYRGKVKTDHPDRGGHPEDFHRLQLAYDTLSDEARRAYYDSTGQTDNVSLEERATTLLAKLVIQVVEAGREDPPMEMRLFIEDKKQKCRAAAAGARKDAARFRAGADRFVVNKKSENLISALKHQAMQLDRQATLVEEDLQTFDLMLQLLRGVRLKAEPKSNFDSFFLIKP